MSAEPKRHWTVVEYLEYDRASDQRHVYEDGEVLLMVGASVKHNIIASNTITSLNVQLGERPCIVFPSDLRVRVSATRYNYPDITVICDPPQIEDDHQDTLLNPTLIIEVLSPSTESYDRGKKFQQYRGIATLQEYVLIAQDNIRVESFLRQANDQWLLSDAAGLNAVIELPSIACTLALSDVYKKVTFDDE